MLVTLINAINTYMSMYYMIDVFITRAATWNFPNMTTHYSTVKTIEIFEGFSKAPTEHSAVVTNYKSTG